MAQLLWNKSGRNLGIAGTKRFPTGTRVSLSSDQLALVGATFFTLACNGPFFTRMLSGRSWHELHAWGLALAVLVMLTSVHVLLLSLLLHRRFAKPVLGVLVLATAFATFYMQQFGVYLDPSMLRNVLKTDWGEARELFSLSLAWHLALYAAVPLVLLRWVRLIDRPWRPAVLKRVGLMLLSLVTFTVALWASFQDISSLFRNEKEIRYLITPENYIYSVARALSAESSTALKPRAVVGADAHMGPLAAGRAKPALLVIVVGETARAANWGLNGYTRQTTRELAKLDVLNFQDVNACGTNTETSLPCMFSQIGRRDYDESRIRGSESLLHVVARAGYQVRWVDNQSGCKGVCDGLPKQEQQAPPAPRACDGEHCLDGVMVDELESSIGQMRGNRVVVLHMLGNHGPAYHLRYPPEMRRFTPTCDTAELNKCSQEQIVNTYDNALGYTDAVLARVVRFLQKQSKDFDAAMIYASDHGESLGEKGLYLHGVPYGIAPMEQKKVPMVWWMSPGFMETAKVDRACLASNTAKPWSHDNLFHTVLGLLDVQTSVYDRPLDITADCRQ